MLTRLLLALLVATPALAGTNVRFSLPDDHPTLGILVCNPNSRCEKPLGCTVTPVAPDALHYECESPDGLLQPGDVAWVETIAHGLRGVPSNKGIPVWACAQDVSGDGVVGWPEFASLLFRAVSGNAGGADYSYLTAAWGETCE